MYVVPFYAMFIYYTGRTPIQISHVHSQIHQLIRLLIIFHLTIFLLSDIMPAFSGVFHTISRDNADLLCHIRNDMGEIAEVTIAYWYPSGETPFPLAFESLKIGRVYSISGEFRMEGTKFKVYPLNKVTDLLDACINHTSATCL
jgi:hypothetical protein